MYIWQQLIRFRGWSGSQCGYRNFKQNFYNAVQGNSTDFSDSSRRCRQNSCEIFTRAT